MNIVTLMLAATVTMQMGDEGRYRTMAQYFSPPPGEEVRLDERELRERGLEQPFRVRGFIGVTPPKGRCITVQQRTDTPDVRICKNETISWNARDIREGGFIEWQVQVEGDASAFSYRWPTPHRVARTISTLNRPKGLSTPELILDCKVTNDELGRRITLSRPARKNWVIMFPRKDRLDRGQPEKEPNLFVQKPKGLQGISEDSTTDVDERYDYDAKRARANAEKKEPVTTYWTIPARDSFAMNSANFLSTDTAPKMNGKCRYRLKQQMDKEAGYIECHDTAEYAVVYVALPCLPALLATAQ